MSQFLNPWRYPWLARWIASSSAARREQRVQAFLDFANPRSSDTVLDLGTIPQPRSSGYLGAINPLESSYPWPDRVLCVGIETDWQLPLRRPYALGDGRLLPVATASVDHVFSNAVIEHVGGPAHARTVIEECWRAARKSVWISTPDRWFPIEIHTFLPVVHWLPLSVYWTVAGRTYAPAYAQPSVHWPLGASDLRPLPSGCQLRRMGAQLIVCGKK
jgi:hypothetical protein